MEPICNKYCCKTLKIVSFLLVLADTYEQVSFGQTKTHAINAFNNRTDYRSVTILKHR
jgi:hypothetical protein